MTKNFSEQLFKNSSNEFYTQQHNGQLKLQLNADSIGKLFPDESGQIRSETIGITLPGGEKLDFTLRHVSQSGPDGIWSWSGYVAGIESAFLLFSVSRLQGTNEVPIVISGSVKLHNRNYLFNSTSEPHQVVLHKSAPKKMVCNCPDIKRTYTDHQPLPEMTGSVSTPTTIKLMIAYGGDLINHYPGGIEGLKVKVANLVTYANLSLNFSGIPAVFDYCYARVDLLNKYPGIKDTYEYFFSKMTPLPEPIDSITDVARAINDLRDKEHADLVVTLTEKHQGFQGRASVIPHPPRKAWSHLAYSICFIAMDGIEDHVIAHELGHLLGLSHDRYTADNAEKVSELAAQDYARGYMSPDRSFCTVMAYERQGALNNIPVYSSPDVLWEGKPTGVRLGAMYPADAASFLRWSIPVVAQYRSHGRKNAYQLIPLVSPGFGGYLLTDKQGPYPTGERVKVRAIAKDGYKFAYFMRDYKKIAPESAEAEIEIQDNDSVITAVFTRTSQFGFRIDASVEPVNAGRIHVVPEMPTDGYAPGTTVQIDVERQHEDLMLIRWEVDGVSEWNSVHDTDENDGNRDDHIRLFVLAESNRKIRAILAKRDCRVLVSGSPANLGCVSTTQIAGKVTNSHAFYRYGIARNEIVTLMAFPYGDAEFSHWLVNGVRHEGYHGYKDTSPSIDLKITDETEVMACFKSSVPSVKVKRVIAAPYAPPYGPAEIEVFPLNTEDKYPDPGFVFTSGSTVEVSIRWYDADKNGNSVEREKYNAVWQVIMNGKKITVPDNKQNFSLTLQQDAEITLTLEPVI